MKGKVPTGDTAGVLRLLKYGSMAQLEALVKLCGGDEGFNDKALLPQARMKTQKVLEKSCEAGKGTEEEALDGVVALGRAEASMQTEKIWACFERAKDGSCACWGRTAPRWLERLPVLSGVS